MLAANVGLVGVAKRPQIHSDPHPPAEVSPLISSCVVSMPALDLVKHGSQALLPIVQPALSYLLITALQVSPRP